MGRQQYLTRLAFGRSPYDDPIRDPEGNLLLSPYARIHDSVGYRQDFDEKGYPRNDVSDQISRRFRRAQNSVLAVTGVVQRKGEAQKSEWEKLKVKEKIRRVVRENGDGKVLKGFHRALGGLAPWSVYALRRRLMCFPHYLELPLFSIAHFEDQFVGIGKCMTAGLLPQLLAVPPQMYRHYVREPDVEDVINYVDPSRYVLGKFENFSFGLVHLPCFAFEVPLHVVSVLQSLLIVRQESWPPILFFIPFSRLSPISLPPLPSVLNASSITKYAVRTAQTPLLLSIIREYIHAQVGYRIYALLRQLLLKPDQPDVISIKAFTELDELDDTSIPGLGRAHATDDDNYVGRYFGPRSFLGAFRLAFPFLYKALNFCSLGRLSRSRGRLDPATERSLRSRIQASYIDRVDWDVQCVQPGYFPDMFLRRELMYEEFHNADLDPDQELVEPYAWLEDVLQDTAVSSKYLIPDGPQLIDLNDLAEESGESPVESDDGAVPQAEPIPMIFETNPVSLPNLPDSARSHRDLAVSDSNDLTTEVPDQPVPTAGQQDLPDTVQDLNVERGGLGHDDSLAGSVLNDTNTSILPLDQVMRPEILPNPVSDSHGSDSPSSVSTPVQGISRAVSLSESSFNQLSPSSSQLRRVRRPTETDTMRLNPQEVLDIDAMLLASGFEPASPETANPNGPAPDAQLLTDDFLVINPQWQRSELNGASPPSPSSSTSSSLPLPFVSHHDPSSFPRHRRRPFRHANRRLPPSLDRQHHYRTTLLSTFAADSLAWHLSSLLTNLFLLPFEIFYIRSIATWYLDRASQPTSDGTLLSNLIDSAGTTGLINDIVFGGQLRIVSWSEGSWLNVAYVGKLVLGLGLEALVRGGLWYWGTRMAMRKGTRMFGWGKF